MAKVKMSSWSSVDLRKSIFMFDPNRAPEGKAEMILDRLLQQFYTVSLYKHYNLVRSSSVRPSLSESILPFSKSTRNKAHTATESYNVGSLPKNSPFEQSQSTIDIVSNQGTDHNECVVKDMDVFNQRSEMDASQRVEFCSIASASASSIMSSVYSTDSVDREFAEYMASKTPTRYLYDTDDSEEEVVVNEVDNNIEKVVISDDDDDDDHDVNSEEETVVIGDNDDDFELSAIDAITQSVMTAISSRVSSHSKIKGMYTIKDTELVGKPEIVTEDIHLPPAYPPVLQDKCETIRKSNGSVLGSDRKRKCSDDLTSGDTPSKTARVSVNISKPDAPEKPSRRKRIARRQKTDVH